MHLKLLLTSTAVLAAAAPLAPGAAGDLERLPYRQPDLAVDLGVGLWAWPMPMDWDGDGDPDLVVSCPDKPYNGTYFFENPGGGKMPVFKPGVKVGPGRHSIQVSHVGGTPRVLTPGEEWIGFLGKEFGETKKIYGDAKFHGGKIRANQWRYVDYDGDGALDLSVGIGDWLDYGWDDAFNEKGEWTRGPLHGYVYILRNAGTDDAPDYQKPSRVQAAGKDVDVFGMPTPNFADFDGDGDLDLLCGEFLDGFTYFQNTGSRKEPRYAEGRRLPVHMDLQMITPTAFDWDGDGDYDLICGDEDGRVAFIEHTGKFAEGVPVFAEPKYFQQEAQDVKFGALATPWGCDWDGDGDEDLLSGNTAGYIAFIENLGGDAETPRFAPPRYLEAGGERLRIQAGPNGSIQGPCEAKWGYTTLSTADWDGDGRLDIVANSIWGKVVWYRNIGEQGAPKLAAAAPVEVAWEGKPPKPAWNWWEPDANALATQWRTTPVARDFTGDGLPDLASLDHEGYLALYVRAERGGKRVLLPPARAFLDENGNPLRLNNGTAGKSGRRKICFADWDGDGHLDLIVNAKNAEFWRNLGTPGEWRFKNEGLVHPKLLAGHTTSPAVVDWDKDGRPEILIGAEDGFFYYLRRP